MAIDAERLERCYLASVRTTPLEAPSRARWARGGDAQFAKTGGVSRMLDSIRAELPARSDETFWVRLAQAVLIADEPAALHGPWPVMGDFDWPIDEKLDALLKERGDASKAVFRRMLWSGIAQDQAVFAGITFLYSYYHHVRVTQLPLLMSSTPTIVALPDYTTLGARGFAFYDPVRFERRRNRLPQWLALTGAGLGRIPIVRGVRKPTRR